MTCATPIPETVTLYVPFRLVKRGGRKEMQMPDRAPPEHMADHTLIKALARSFRWKRMLELGEFATIAELAEREGINRSYLCRVLRLTLLAPDLVEAILDGHRPQGLTLEAAIEPVPMAWQVQRVMRRFGLNPETRPPPVLKGE